MEYNFCSLLFSYKCSYFDEEGEVETEDENKI